jgi:hypothetical protein
MWDMPWRQAMEAATPSDILWFAVAVAVVLGLARSLISK